MMQVDWKPQFIVLPGSLPWNVAFSSFGHEPKQLPPKEVTEEGIVMLVKPEHPQYLLLVDYQYYTL